MDRIEVATQPFFTLVAQIRSSGDAAIRPEVVYSKLRESHQRALEAMKASGTSEDDCRLVGYALAAFADESMLGASPEIRDYWIPRLLQYEIYRDNQAGERLFQHLEQLMREPGRVEVLRLYFRILLLGFRGRYALPGRELGLEELIDRVAARLRDLRSLVTPPLSPRGHRPHDATVAPSRGWPVVGISAAAFLSTLTIFIALRVDMSARTAALIERLGTLDLGIW